VKWFAYNDFPDFILFNDLSEVLHVPLPAGSPQCRTSLGGYQHRIAHGNADIPVPYV
jgi:hypothetical protein